MEERQPEGIFQITRQSIGFEVLLKHVIRINMRTCVPEDDISDIDQQLHSIDIKVSFGMFLCLTMSVCACVESVSDASCLYVGWLLMCFVTK